MTIAVTIPQETKSLIQPLSRTFYPTSIPQQHHQLKNLMSTKDSGFIYYASKCEIFALHTKSRKRESIAKLPWEPQCLDASYGWVCVGGPNNGQCAFVFVGEEQCEGQRGRESTFDHPVEVDALLPLDLNPESRLLAHSFLHRNQTISQITGRRKPEVQIHEVGGSIVNSVTVHRLLSDQKGLEDEIVAVLTNNDQTIRIFSLSQSCLLSQMTFPTAMNHASISPDGNLIIAVGDESQVFFCQRTPVPTSLPVDGETSFARYEWHEIAEPKLSFARPLDACFSTAFSPSGHICAAASQAGVINIFDTSLIRSDMESDDAVIEVLKSSRPCLGRDCCGSVRSMSFGPPPWDLFAWAEDQGRVCVIDLRNDFRLRQTIELEIDSPNLVVASIVDLTDSNMTVEQRQLEIEERIMRRHQEAFDADDHVAAVSHATDYIELAAERRRIERETREAGLPVFGEEYNLLSDRERQVIDSIRLSRLQENEQGRTDRTDSHMVNGLRSATLTLASHNPQGNRGTHSIRDYMRQRDLERTRPGDRSYQPRRRSSVVISNGSATNNSSSSHPSDLAPTGTAIPTLSASPSRLSSSTVPSAPTAMSGDPWQTIIEAVAPSTPSLDILRLRREHDAFFGTADRGNHQQAAPLERSRNRTTNMIHARPLHRISMQRAAVAEGNLDEESDLMRHAQDTRGSREDGVGTMGIGWSRDGRNLYVATEEGILEYTVNIDERKTFPRIDLR